MRIEEIKTFAPVIIPTLNRFDHFKRCLESLERCTDADKTDVYVGLDYPPSEHYVEGWKKIDEYLYEKEKNHGFKNLYVRRRDHNCGVGNIHDNGSLLRQEVRQVSDRFISTEDDNEFSPNFLSYCNWGLDYFKNDDRVLAICGYNLIETPHLKNNVYMYNHGFCAWGAAYLFSRRDRLESLYNFEVIKNNVDKYPVSIIFSNKVFLAASMLHMIKTNHILGDTVLQLISDDQKWCVFPRTSMVRNWGHDGSGLHGGTKESFEKQISLSIDQSAVFAPQIGGELYTPEIEEAYRLKYGKKSLVSRIRAIGRFLIYKMTGIIVVLKRPKWLKR